MRLATWRPGLLGLAVVALVASASAAVAQLRVLQPGDPLPGLTPAQFELFRLGLDDFLEVETAEEGLGPAFNGASCAVCHSVPAVGGAGLVTEVRAGRQRPDGSFAAVVPTGETLFQLFAIPGHACQPQLPPEVNVVARRISMPLFGAGLVEAIPDVLIMAREDADDLDGDGVSGRAALVTDIDTGQLRVGRFGWKAQHATLLAFAADAYRNEMGITNDLFPQETAPGIAADILRECDPIPDPEDVRDPRTHRRGIDNFESFLRFLAPVQRRGAGPEAAYGQELFESVGCAACHVPELTTGPSADPLFDRAEVPLFSDLLLHDVGTGDGIPQGAASAAEIRTPALWGLRLRRPLLHDGSAATIADAILRHQGEAASALRRYGRLTPAQRSALTAFLETL